MIAMYPFHGTVAALSTKSFYIDMSRAAPSENSAAGAVFTVAVRCTSVAGVAQCASDFYCEPVTGAACAGHTLVASVGETWTVATFAMTDLTQWLRLLFTEQSNLADVMIEGMIVVFEV